MFWFMKTFVRVSMVEKSQKYM